MPQVTVEHYFNAHFPFTEFRSPDDEGNMPIASICGTDCRKAIDAGAALLRCHRAAMGDNDVFRELIARKVEDIVLVYICG